MAYELAKIFLFEEKKIKKFDRILNLDLLEKLLINNKLKEYFDFKNKIFACSNCHIKDYPILYREFISNEIEQIDMEIYLGNFESGQNIKYFREYLKKTIESENYSPHGSIIELKAYAKAK